jgi:ABC-type uncharacterized transport system substrate-binding protein
MKPYTRQRRGICQVELWVLLLAASVLFLDGSGVGAQGRQVRVAVLTTGLSSTLVLEGLREGLAQLGYHEGENIAFIVEDTQGEVTSLASQAAKIVEANPDLIFTVGTTPTVTASRPPRRCPSSSPLLAIRYGRAWSPAMPRHRIT